VDAIQRWGLRVGVLTELVERAPTKLGRTGVMKLAFLLQTVKGVPLGYNFRLYTYGPFDGDVLDDLGQAETMKAIESAVVSHPSGYGYEFSPGPERERVKAIEGAELAKYRDAISWALSGFGCRTAADLELISTIVYADRDACERRQRIAPDELCRQVREIKPRFSEEYVRQTIASLAEKGLLVASHGDVAPGSPR
jgi:hypothetical protein